MSTSPAPSPPRAALRDRLEPRGPEPTVPRLGIVPRPLGTLPETLGVRPPTLAAAPGPVLPDPPAAPAPETGAAPCDDGGPGTGAWDGGPGTGAGPGGLPAPAVGTAARPVLRPVTPDGRADVGPVVGARSPQRSQ
ncbi:hypothetical protein [Plantactinospora sp. B24E8]|uniref:hypothetical protein n=1 Tax=Plantactinospora sp. B24E8 TaxID=3153567 RepID=UPI00325E632B